MIADSPLKGLGMQTKYDIVNILCRYYGSCNIKCRIAEDSKGDSECVHIFFMS